VKIYATQIRSLSGGLSIYRVHATTESSEIIAIGNIAAKTRDEAIIKFKAEKGL